MTPQRKGEIVRIGRHSIEVSHPDKLLFPKDGITKLDLVRYYERVAPTMLPYLKGRPITMQRYPNGIHGQGFFEQKAPSYFPEWIKTAPLPKKSGELIHVICDDASTLVYLANLAVITPHAWLSRIDKPNQPDQIIFDLDPSQNNFRAVCAAAKDLRKRLKELGLEAFVKTTGSRGLHVLSPLTRGAGFEEVRAFARDIAARAVEEDPEHLTIEVRKNKRDGRIFVDTARNAYGQTAAPPYAVRPRDGAPIAAPLYWEELESPWLRADWLNLNNVFFRLRRSGDPWKDLKKHARKLPRQVGSHVSR